MCLITQTLSVTLSTGPFSSSAVVDFEEKVLAAINDEATSKCLEADKVFFAEARGCFPGLPGAQFYDMLEAIGPNIDKSYGTAMLLGVDEAHARI